jgi:multidrug efflux system outer membrane protein
MSSFELDFWGRVAALDEAARSQYLASEAAAAAFRIGLIGDVANTWLLYGELAQRERLAEATLSGRVAGRDLLAKRRDAGVTTDLDVLAAEGIVESVRAQIAELRRQRAQTANALRLLTGATGELPAPPGADAPPLVADFAPGLPSEVLVRRPDVRAAEERLIASNANVGAARAAFFPRVGITLTGGLAGGSIDGLFDAGSGAWIWQPVIRLPIFDSGRLQSNLDLAEARKVAAVADYERTIQQAFREVSDLLAARSTLAEQVAAQEANLAAQRQRLARVLARYRAGLSNYLEVLDAEREVFVYEQAVVVTRRQMQAVAVGMYKALGTD